MISTVHIDYEEFIAWYLKLFLYQWIGHNIRNAIQYDAPPKKNHPLELSALPFWSCQQKLKCRIYSSGVVLDCTGVPNEEADELILSIHIHTAWIPKDDVLFLKL